MALNDENRGGQKSGLQRIIAPKTPLSVLAVDLHEYQCLRYFEDHFHSQRPLQVLVEQLDWSSLFTLRAVSKAFQAFVDKRARLPRAKETISQERAMGLDESKIVKEEPAMAKMFRWIYFRYPDRRMSIDKAKSAGGIERISRHAEVLHLTILPTLSHDVGDRGVLHMLLFMLGIGRLRHITIRLDTEDLSPPCSHLSEESEELDAPLHLWTYPASMHGTRDNLLTSHQESLRHLKQSMQGHDYNALHSLTFENLSIAGVMAFRSQPLQKVAVDARDSRSFRAKIFWDRITRLEVRMIKWWHLEDTAARYQGHIAQSRAATQPYVDNHRSNAPSTGPSAAKNAGMQRSHDSRAVIATTASSAMTRKISQGEYKHAKKDGIKILHSWLESFSANLEALSFSWAEPDLDVHLSIAAAQSRRAVLEDYPGVFQTVVTLKMIPRSGYNPMLLDRVNAPPMGRGWFSAAAIRWKRLARVSLETTGVDKEALLDMLNRAERLEHIIIHGGYSSIAQGSGVMFEPPRDGTPYVSLKREYLAGLREKIKKEVEDDMKLCERMWE